MQRKSHLALAIVLLLSLSSPVYAAAPKTGSKCTKAGATATSAGKKYTCIKSGKNLVWDKGVVIPAVTKTPVVEAKNLLSADSRITPTAELTNIDTCKTTDNTPMQIFSGNVFTNGFPRPAQTLTGKKLAKILVIPISFKNLPFTVEKTQRGQTFTSDIEAMSQVIPLVEDLFKTISVGRFEVKIDILPHSDWWVINEDQSFSDVWGLESKVPKIAEIIGKYKPDFKFDGYDAYVFAGGNGPANMRGIGAAEAALAYPIANAKKGYFSGMIAIGGFTDPAMWVHELGHALFFLEDLYNFDNPTELPSGKGATVPFLWDVMAESTKRQFLEWNRLLMGWLQDSEMRCLTNQKTSVHFLAEYGATTYPKLLTINLAPGVTLAAEARNATNSEKGLLLYKIDTNIAHGAGPIITQNTLLTKGKSQSWLGWEFTVLDTNTSGVLVSVTKTDIDKYVPPVGKPAVQNNPVTPKSTVIVTKGDIVPNGSLAARATWNVTGHESYRLYVTDVVDFQKVYFETGVVNDSSSPLVIDIKGLVCNKEFRTVTEFYSKKNGEGERQVIQSLQLRNLSCP